MSWDTDRARFLLWACTALMSAMTMIVGALAWADHAELGQQAIKIERVDAHREDDHEAIQETRQDVKEIKSYLMDRLRK